MEEVLLMGSISFNKYWLNVKKILPLFNISRNIDFQPGFLKIGWTKINFDNGFEFLRSFSWFAIVFVLALKWLLPGKILAQSLKTCFVHF